MLPEREMKHFEARIRLPPPPPLLLTAGLTVKVIGRQWYWSYEMHDHLQHKLLDPDRLVALAEKSVLKA